MIRTAGLVLAAATLGLAGAAHADETPAAPMLAAHAHLTYRAEKHGPALEGDVTVVHGPDQTVERTAWADRHAGAQQSATHALTIAVFRPS
jgi:hypothetical protein